MSGLAKLEGELIDCDSEEVAKDTCTKYQLTGIVVHSGQASGGHYYSFILHRLADGSCKWYKFDDNDVSEWKMDDDEEMKAQCFGGDYLGEMYDSVLKRPSCRRQKRWWNAYMLFYTRLDAINPSNIWHSIIRPKSSSSFQVIISHRRCLRRLRGGFVIKISSLCTIAINFAQNIFNLFEDFSSAIAPFPSTKTINWFVPLEFHFLNTYS